MVISEIFILFISIEKTIELDSQDLKFWNDKIDLLKDLDRFDEVI